MVNKQADSFHGELWFFTQQSGERRFDSLTSIDIRRFSSQSNRSEGWLGRSECVLFWSWKSIMYETRSLLSVPQIYSLLLSASIDVSISGRAHLVHDNTKKKNLWTDSLKAW